jgi:hypothetical protein
MLVFIATLSFAMVLSNTVLRMNVKASDLQYSQRLPERFRWGSVISFVGGGTES